MRILKSNKKSGDVKRLQSEATSAQAFVDELNNGPSERLKESLARLQQSFEDSELEKKGLDNLQPQKNSSLETKLEKLEYKKNSFKQRSNERSINSRHQVDHQLTTDAQSNNQVDNSAPSLLADQNSTKKQHTGVYERAIRLLSMREHSVHELTDKLSRKGEPLDLVYQVVDELVENNYVSDDRFTESYVRSRQNRSFGPIKIRKELMDKGIKSQMIDDYLTPNSAVWYDNAQALYERKYRGQAIGDYNTWTKRARFLQSRGFTMEHIQVTVPKVDFD